MAWGKKKQEEPEVARVYQRPSQESESQATDKKEPEVRIITDTQLINLRIDAIMKSLEEIVKMLESLMEIAKA